MQGISETATANWQWSTEGASKPAPKVKGKRDAVHRPGNKKELRRALIEQKRAERTSKAGHFEAQVMFEALHAMSLSAEGCVWTTPVLGTVGREVAVRIATHLGFTCTEVGAGDRKAVHCVRASGTSAPLDDEIVQAQTAAVAFDDTASGRGVAATLQEQRAIARKIRDKKAKAAAGQPLTRKLRQLYPEGSDSSEDSEDEAGEAHIAEGAATRTRQVAVVRQPVSFVQGGVEGSQQTTLTDAPAAAVAGPAQASPFQALAGEDSSSCEEEDAIDEEDSDQDEEDGTGHLVDKADGQLAREHLEGSQAGLLGEDEDASTPHCGLGVASSVLNSLSVAGPHGGSHDTQVQDDQASVLGLVAGVAGIGLGTSAPVTAEWEGHTRGIGSKLMSRMGYRGGQLPGGTGKGRTAHEGEGGTAEGTVHAPMGSLPEPIGESVVVRKDKRGIGS